LDSHTTIGPASGAHSGAPDAAPLPPLPLPPSPRRARLGIRLTAGTRLVGTIDWYLFVLVLVWVRQLVFELVGWSVGWSLFFFVSHSDLTRMGD
jgi:hypothetical protein